MTRDEMPCHGSRAFAIALVPRAIKVWAPRK